jgi:hypothetical protein
MTTPTVTHVPPHLEGVTRDPFIDGLTSGVGDHEVSAPVRRSPALASAAGTRFASSPTRLRRKPTASVRSEGAACIR